MKTWQILMVIWFVAAGMMLMNHFHRGNLEREQKKKKG